MKALLVLSLLLLQVGHSTHAAEAMPTSSFFSQLPLDFAASPPFWVDRSGREHPDAAYFGKPTETKTDGNVESLYTPIPTDDQSRISVLRSTDGALKSIVRSDRKNNLNTVMEFTANNHLSSQSICRNSKCIEITPTLCTALLDETKVNNVNQLLATQSKCNVLSNAFNTALSRTRGTPPNEFPKSLKTLYGSQAWATSNRSIVEKISGAIPSSYDQRTETSLTNDQLVQLTQQQADILKLCAHYESHGVFVAPVGTGQTNRLGIPGGGVRSNVPIH